MITHIFLKEASVFNFSQRNPISVKIASNTHIYDMDIYEFIMPDEMVMPAVETACSFFPDFITFLRHHIAHNDNQRVT